jgi:hypothetical protein
VVIICTFPQARCPLCHDSLQSCVEIHFNNFLQSTPSLTGSISILVAGNPPVNGPSIINLTASITDNEFDGCDDNDNLGNAGGCIDLYYNVGRTQVANNRFFNFVYASIKVADSPTVDIHDNVIDGPAMSLISGNGYMPGAYAPNVACILSTPSFARPSLTKGIRPMRPLSMTTSLGATTASAALAQESRLKANRTPGRQGILMNSERS